MRLDLAVGRPELFDRTGSSIWTEPHIQEQLLAAHLDPAGDGASRRRPAIRRTVEYIAGRIRPGGRILDLGCGPGLYAAEFLARKFQVVGVDFNRASVEYARRSAPEAEFIEADYLAGLPAGPFDAVVMIYCDMGTHADRERDRLLRRCFDALLPGGKLIFDVFDESILTAKPEERGWEYAPAGGFWSSGEYLLLREVFHYPASRAVGCRYQLIEGGGVRRFPVWDRYYRPAELGELLEAAGFVEVVVEENVLPENNFVAGRVLFAVAVKP